VSYRCIAGLYAVVLGSGRSLSLSLLGVARVRVSGVGESREGQRGVGIEGEVEGKGETKESGL